MENLPQLQQKLTSLIDRYHDVQQDILQTFIDRLQLQTLTQPTVLPGGKRIPGLKLDHPRQLAVMHALVRFSSLAAGSTFTTAELHPHVLRALGLSAADYKLGSLRYDLWKLRAKRSDQKDSSFPPLSAAAQRLSDLCGVPKAVRKALRPAHRRHFAALCR